ncbi:MAG: serine hydrolase [Bacilli bacterium]|nr:serine hydrolase [Bacilli bacterium]
MEEDKNIKYVKKNSSVSKNSKKKSTKKVNKSVQLDNDALLDEILKKSKAKKAVAKAKRATKKIEPTALSSDELFDQIMAKKAAKKKKVVPAKDVKSVLTTDLKSKDKSFNSVNAEIIDDNLDEVQELNVPVIQEPVETGIFAEIVEEKQQSVDDVEKIEFVEFVDDVKKPKRKRKKCKFNGLVLFLLLVIVCLVCGISIMLLYEPSASAEIEIPIVEEYYDSKPLEYQECLKRSYDDVDITSKLQDGINDLSIYVNDKYNASISYEDLTTSFTYSYKVDNLYYAASTIKALDGLYIYSKAASGELSLDDTIVYSSKYKRAYSSGMSKHKIGEAVSLRNLVKYAITVSDNTAHEMLIDYIGKSELRRFGLSLGASYTLYGGDNFGHITSSDALIYAKALNSFIIMNDKLGLELQQYLIDAAQNGLEIESKGILAGHKYGEYDVYYHDYGIVYDTYPYVVAIMTSEGHRKDFQAVIKDINSRVYDLHNLFHENREEICYGEVYGN